MVDLVLPVASEGTSASCSQGWDLVPSLSLLAMGPFGTREVALAPFQHTSDPQHSVLHVRSPRGHHC